MKDLKPMLPMFQKFIRDSETGKRLKKNGERIKESSIKTYRFTYQNLKGFSEAAGFDLRICPVNRLTQREYRSEKNYWKKFYKRFTDYLYRKGCHDNYVGHNIKIIRTFFGYVKFEFDIDPGDFHKMFYVRKEVKDILVLSPEQLKFLIHDRDFHRKLSRAEKRIKDIFVFGCTTGLRFSDIFQITNKNFEYQDGHWYLKLRSQKTKIQTSIKLPAYAVEIFQYYRPRSNKIPVFKSIALFNFNKNLKQIGEKAQFVWPIELSQEKRGKIKWVDKNFDNKTLRFCDKMSSHMMRRTAITTLLILGMPEHMVRKISGHSANSTSFNRYVHYAQVYIDRETDKVFEKLAEYSKTEQQPISVPQ